MKTIKAARNSPSIRDMFARKRAWVCPACGKFAEVRTGLRDSSCYMHAVEVWADTMVIVDGWRCIKADAI